MLLDSQSTNSGQHQALQHTSSPAFANDDVYAQLDQYRPIDLTQMEEVALLKRVEVKYVMPRTLLPNLLETLRESYSVLAVADQRLNRYRTLYFDTVGFDMYRRHHAGASDRYKVRSRTYVESDRSFLEVKHKTNKKRVTKSRIPTSDVVMDFDQGSATFVQDACPYDVGDIQPRLWNSYQRITLVSKHRKERVTLDIGLHFDWQGRSISLPHIAIAEVKQERFSHSSDFIGLMKQHHIRSGGFSKYCMGASLLYPDLKQNRFKAKHRLVTKLAGTGSMGGELNGLH